MDTGIRSLRKVFRNGSCSDWPLAMTFSLFFKQADAGEHTTGSRDLTAPSKEAGGRDQGCAEAYKALRIMGIEHMDAGHRTQPRHLPFGELTRCGLRSCHRCFERITTGQVRPELPVTHGADRWMRVGEVAALLQPADFP